MKALTHQEAWAEARRRLDVSVSADLTLTQWATAYEAAQVEWWGEWSARAEADEAARSRLAWAIRQTEPATGDTVYLPDTCDRVLDVTATFTAGGADRTVSVAPRAAEALALADPWNTPDRAQPVYTEGGITEAGKRRLLVYSDETPRGLAARYLTGMPPVALLSDTAPPYPRQVQMEIQEIALRKLAAAVQDSFRYQAAAQVETKPTIT